MRPFDIIIYGSYGYTGRLIVLEGLRRGLKILLAGRNVEQLSKQAGETGLEFEVAAIDDKSALDHIVARGKLVIHCAGPFLNTARRMVEACLRSGTHYADITGEYEVFELLATYHNEAREKGIVIMPGTGFDVVPSDCLAVHLHQRLPSATHLQLAFAMSKGGLSRGTSKTMVEGLGSGSVIREDGKLKHIALGSRTMVIDFGSFNRHTLCIPWGDVSTAYRSTGIPNIEVYSGVPEKTITMAKLSWIFNPVIRARWFKDFLLRRIDSRPAGPSAEKLSNGKSYLWGKVWDEQRSFEARLVTLNGYALTAKTAILISSRIIRETRSGFFTPAQYFGEHLILEIEGSQLT
jgi:short subunit dehydrogenase-like uncharacterized protein